MRSRFLPILAPLSLLAMGVVFASAVPGCATTGAVEGGLGKVVIYRNGVAYYERRARTTSGELHLSVPREQVDDFLKSLTVRDAKTKKSLPVSFPSQGTASGGLIEMAVRLPPNAPSDVILTYITESPAWKPSYRISMVDEGTIEIEGWAIVDNTSGETWEEVMVGVGSSSALSFRFDLWSIRDVRRQTLSGEERFAVAPPTGASTFKERGAEKVLTEITADQLNTRVALGGAAGDDDAPPAEESIEVESTRLTQPAPTVDGRSYSGSLRKRAKRKSAKQRAAEKKARLQAERERAEAKRRYDRNARLADKLAKDLKVGNRAVVIEGWAQVGESNPGDRALQRANTMRNELIQRGVPPALLKVRSAGAAEGRPGGVRLVADGTGAKKQDAGPPGEQAPVGESHFQSETPITVPRGTSTMVSIVKKRTPGKIVYLYDSESERGNQNFAFRAIRLVNPTDNTLESGPVTVYGDDRFIGEGLTEPIPPKSAALVPFALDRQVVVERKVDRRDQIAGLVKLQRGSLSTEIQHIRDTQLKLTNRLHKNVTVYVRHTVVRGWDLLGKPETERQGSAHLFPVELASGETKSLSIREATPIVRTLDLRSDETIDMLEAYLTTSAEHAKLAEQMKPLLALHRSMADHRAAIVTLREQMADYRTRMDELHAQIVTLKAVKSGGDLTRHLKKKMQEISERVQRSTLSVVSHQEKLMLTRIKFQDAIAELSLAKLKKKVAKSE